MAPHARTGRYCVGAEAPSTAVSAAGLVGQRARSAGCGRGRGPAQPRPRGVPPPGRCSTSSRAGGRPELGGSFQGRRLAAAAAESAAGGDPAYEVKLERSMSAIVAAEWDACAAGAAAGDLNPFCSHAFLLALEESGSVCARTGWLPQHLTLRARSGGPLLGAAPLYVKAHSMGEYVFDQSWAAAASRAGLRYYPKLQCSVPFTPVTGPRLLLRADAPAGAAAALASALAATADTLGVSSAHITFPTRAQAAQLAAAGFLPRLGLQYWWRNAGYSSFDGGDGSFAMALTQKRRKALRQERRKATEGLRVRRLRGSEISAAQWDCFYDFYTDTADRKWGQAYLTRDFFHRMGAALGDAPLLVLAERAEAGGGGEPVGAALNLVGAAAIFGRNWGCRGFTPGLHFELCYYQAIEEAITHGLARVEAGAQGEHKLGRGYTPALTHSAHYLRDPSLAAAVGDFLAREGPQVLRAAAMLDAEETPYREEAQAAASWVRQGDVEQLVSELGLDALILRAQRAWVTAAAAAGARDAGEGDGGVHSDGPPPEEEPY